MLERRAARISISAFFAGPACLHLLLSPPFSRICGALQLTFDSCNRVVRRPIRPGPRMMCSMGYGVITHRENIRPPQQKGQDARITAMIRFVCKARTRHSWSPSWAGPECQAGDRRVNTPPAGYPVVRHCLVFWDHMWAPMIARVGKRGKFKDLGWCRIERSERPLDASGCCGPDGMDSRSCMSGGQNT